MDDIKEAIKWFERNLTEFTPKQIKTALSALRTIEWIKKHHPDYSHKYAGEIMEKFNSYQKE